MEDFGYKKNYDHQDRLRIIIRQIFLSFAAIFSLSAFIYVTYSAYGYIYNKNHKIERIKAPDFEIKILAENEEEGDSLKIDRKIYEDIFGNKKASKKEQKVKLQEVVTPSLPPKEEKLIVENEASKKEVFQEKEIIVFNKDKKEKSRDLLTDFSSEKRDNSAAPERRKQISKSSKIRVQIAAMSSKDSAQKSFESLKNKYPTLFDNLNSHIEKVDLQQRGIFYRLQVGNFFNQIEAESFCSRYVAALKKAPSDCIIVE
jgi:hypothetical protein